jgi:Tannase and feruloyl esterase
MVDVTTVNGTTTAAPEPLAQSFIQYLLKKDPTYDLSTINYADYVSLFAEAIRELDYIVGSNDPDLSTFRKGGGKLLSWHGLADNLVGSHSTLKYRQQVDALLGGTDTVDHFYRLFFAPGINHCGAGYGPIPTGGLSQLVAWVEHGIAPETLPASFIDVKGDTVQHDICRYPLVSRYIGGNPKTANSYICANSF